jgi:hypothetical protein
MRLAGEAFGISQTCCLYVSVRYVKNGELANWLLPRWLQ